MTFDELKEKAHALPLKPGVYIMQDKRNEVIYVGKAKALKDPGHGGLHRPFRRDRG